MREREPLPADACSYWGRQLHREVDEHDFGCSPWDLMSEAQAERHMAAQEAEDRADPPCGRCPCCLASEDDGGPPAGWVGDAEA